MESARLPPAKTVSASIIMYSDSLMKFQGMLQFQGLKRMASMSHSKITGYFPLILGKPRRTRLLNSYICRQKAILGRIAFLAWFYHFPAVAVKMAVYKKLIKCRRQT